MKMTKDGVCLLCLQPAEWISTDHNRDGYHRCNCDSSKEYRDLYSRLSAIEEKAQKNKDNLKREEEIKDLKRRLKALEGVKEG